MRDAARRRLGVRQAVRGAPSCSAASARSPADRAVSGPHDAAALPRRRRPDARRAGAGPRPGRRAQGRPVRRPAAARRPRRSRSSSRSPAPAPGCRSRSASPSSARTRSSSTRGSTQLGRGETIEDTARVLSRYVDADRHPHLRPGPDRGAGRGQQRAGRQRAHRRLHPCQVLADLQTVRERRGRTEGLTLTYLGDGANNMAHSPARRRRDGRHARADRRARGLPAGPGRRRARPARTAPTVARHRPTRAEAAAGADVLSPTCGSRWAWRTSTSGARDLTPYALDEEALAAAADDAVVLHCLPAHRGEEIAAAVIDGPQSAVWDEAENRLHAQKALLACLLERSDAVAVDRTRRPRAADQGRPAGPDRRAARARGRSPARPSSAGCSPPPACGHPGHASAATSRSSARSRSAPRPGMAYALPPEERAPRGGTAEAVDARLGRLLEELLVSRRGHRRPRRPAHAARRRPPARLGARPRRPARGRRHRRRRRHRPARHPRPRPRPAPAPSPTRLLRLAEGRPLAATTTPGRNAP